MKAVWGYRFNARRLQPYGVLESWYLHTFSGQPRLGFKVFHEWSATGGASYKGERDCQIKWQHCAKIEKIHIATVFHYANQHDPSWRDGVSRVSEKPLIR